MSSLYIYGAWQRGRFVKILPCHIYICHIRDNLSESLPSCISREIRTFPLFCNISLNLLFGPTSLNSLQQIEGFIYSCNILLFYYRENKGVLSECELGKFPLWVVRLCTGSVSPFLCIQAHARFLVLIRSVWLPFEQWM